MEGEIPFTGHGRVVGRASPRRAAQDHRWASRGGGYEKSGKRSHGGDPLEQPVVLPGGRTDPGRHGADWAKFGTATPPERAIQTIHRSLPGREGSGYYGPLFDPAGTCDCIER